MGSGTQAGGRLQGVDALRGFSALAVFFCHIAAYWTFMSLPGKLPQLFVLGAHGVDVFIVISGFCLFLPVLGSHGRLAVSQFYGRRALRILPAYYVALTLATILAMSRMWHHFVAAPATRGDLLAHVLGVQTWVPPVLGTINGSLWSISLELNLYLVFPALVWLWYRRGWKAVVFGAGACAVVWELAGWVLQGTAVGPYLGDGHALPARLIQFTIGMKCAELVMTRQLPSPRTCLAGVAVTGLIGTIALTLGWPQSIRAMAWGMVGLWAILSVGNFRWTGRLASVGDRLGAKSFSFYLIHQPTLLGAAWLVAKLPGGWALQLAVGGSACLVLTYLMAHVLFATVEAPSHRVGRRLFPRPTPKPSKVEGAVGELPAT